MRIAYLNNMQTTFFGSGGHVHVSQVADKLFKRGHILYTNLLNESDRFVKLSHNDFLLHGKEIEAFYIRLHGSDWNDKLTLHRAVNVSAPCIWEINAPIEEIRTRGISEDKISEKVKHRKELAQLVDAALCVSREMEEYAQDELGIDKTFVVPNGSDSVLFTPEKRDYNIYNTSYFKVLWSGSSQYPWQAFKTVVKLAEKLKVIDKEILIVVTGEGESLDNILYLGHIPYSEMPKYMASADVGLCIYENIDFYKKFFFSPLKLYDYMASGLPVIGSALGQIKLVLEENQNGLLTDTTIEDLIDKILYLKKNKALAQEMANNGRKAVVEYYNWERVALIIEKIIQEQIEQKNNQQKIISEFTINCLYREIERIENSKYVEIKNKDKQLKQKKGQMKQINDKLTEYQQMHYLVAQEYQKLQMSQAVRLYKKLEHHPFLLKIISYIFNDISSTK